MQLVRAGRVASTRCRVYHSGGGGGYNFAVVVSFWAPLIPRPARTHRPGRAGAHGAVLEPVPRRRARRRVFNYAVASASSWFYQPSMLHEGGRLVGCHHCLLPNVTNLMRTWPPGRAALCPVLGSGGATMLRTMSPSQCEGGGVEKGRQLRSSDRKRPFKRSEKRDAGHRA
ncbi:hypothetical protein E2562_015355 [Oryza meyeriana var. granulata]|uniref:Uncharacterized protein n=1 Tax=Oryza meyeriana var. granulata TaxID=110450 RepID=A0A6G1EKW4_9ORYZ|nr:hypothetical protein E2562_015355 [Oryza meyeriana var. granulata]